MANWTLPALVGVGAAFALYEVSKHGGANGGDAGGSSSSSSSSAVGGAATPSPAGIVAPSNLVDLMNNAYYGYKRIHGAYPASRAAWIDAMQTAVYPLSTNAWGYIYDQGVGYIQLHQTTAPESVQEGWFNYAANNL
jgi:hypothetical protein